MGAILLRRSQFLKTLLFDPSSRNNHQSRL
jgi:hypothetical protein